MDRKDHHPLHVGTRADRWFIVASRAGARILEELKQEKSPRLIQTLSHPESRKKSAELGSDRPGRSFDSNAGSHQRHAMSEHVDPHQREADRFAKEIADMLCLSRTQNKFEQLVLVAEPAFLGKIRGHLDGPTAKLVVKSLEKDWLEVKDRDLPTQLAEAGLTK